MVSMDKLTDAELVIQYKNGEVDALNILVKRKHVTFCEKAFGLVKDKDLAKDIAQNTWSTIIKNIDSLKNPNSFKSWSARILYVTSIDALRLQTRERKQKTVFKREAAIEESAIEEDREHLKSKLLQAIKELPGNQQAVIKLFYVEEYSLKEIAKILKINTGTVKSRLFHAREKLKKKLNRNNY